MYDSINSEHIIFAMVMSVYIYIYFQDSNKEDMK